MLVYAKYNNPYIIYHTMVYVWKVHAVFGAVILYYFVLKFFFLYLFFFSVNAKDCDLTLLQSYLFELPLEILEFQ